MIRSPLQLLLIVLFVAIAGLLVWFTNHFVEHPILQLYILAFIGIATVTIALPLSGRLSRYLIPRKLAKHSNKVGLVANLVRLFFGQP